MYAVDRAPVNHNERIREGLLHSHMLHRSSQHSRMVPDLEFPITCAGRKVSSLYQHMML